MVKGILDDYLEKSGRRKTPERYAILDAAMQLKGHFSIDDLSLALANNNFHVSRATLYNTIKLFVNGHLLICHRIQNSTRYEFSRKPESHVYLTCKECGKVSETEAKSISRAISVVKARRFKKDGFVLYIYGICSSCLAKASRRNSI